MTTKYHGNMRNKDGWELLSHTRGRSISHMVVTCWSWWLHVNNCITYICTYVGHIGVFKSVSDVVVDLMLWLLAHG